MKKMALAVGLLFVCIDMQGASQDTDPGLKEKKIGDLSLWEEKDGIGAFGLIEYPKKDTTDSASKSSKVLIKGCCGVLATDEGVSIYSIKPTQFSFEIWYKDLEEANDNIQSRLIRLDPNSIYYKLRRKNTKETRNKAQVAFKELTLAESKKKSSDDFAKIFYTAALVKIKAQMEELEKSKENKS